MKTTRIQISNENDAVISSATPRRFVRGPSLLLLAALAAGGCALGEGEGSDATSGEPIAEGAEAVLLQDMWASKAARIQQAMLGADVPLNELQRIGSHNALSDQTFEGHWTSAL